MSSIIVHAAEDIRNGSQSLRVVRQLEESLWPEFVDNHPHGNIFHTPEMFRVFANTTLLTGCNQDATRRLRGTLLGQADHHFRLADPEEPFLPGHRPLSNTSAGIHQGVLEMKQHHGQYQAEINDLRVAQQRECEEKIEALTLLIQSAPAAG